MNILNGGKSKRKRYLIHEFQYRLLAMYVFYFFLVIFIFAGSLFLPLMIDMGDRGLPLHEQEAVSCLTAIVRACEGSE